MKRLLKSWVFWAFAVPPFALAASLLIGRVRSEEFCQDCLSTRWVTHGYAGLPRGGSLQVSPKRREVVESHYLRDFLSGSHVHTWALKRRSTSTLFSSTSGVGRAGGPNDLGVSYESTPGFREFLLRKLDAGEVAKEDAMEALRLPRYMPEIVRLEGRHQRLIRLGKSWMEEYSKTSPPR